MMLQSGGDRVEDRWRKGFEELSPSG